MCLDALICGLFNLQVEIHAIFGTRVRQCHAWCLTRKDSPTNGPFSTSFDPNRNRNTSPQSWNKIQSIAPLRIWFYTFLTKSLRYLTNPVTRALLTGFWPNSSNITWNEFYIDRGCRDTPIWAGLLFWLSSYSRSFDLYARVRHAWSRDRLINAARWVLIRFTKASQILKAETYSFRMHHSELCKSLRLQKLCLTPPTPKSVTSIFHDRWSLFDSGISQAPLYTIRVGSVRHTSHSKEPSISGLRISPTAVWQLGWVSGCGGLISICEWVTSAGSAVSGGVLWAESAESWAISFFSLFFLQCVQSFSYSAVLQWAKFTDMRALVPRVWMDRSSLYEYAMRKHSKIQLFARTCALIY